MFSRGLLPLLLAMLLTVLLGPGPAAATESFLEARRTWLDPEALGEGGEGVIHTLHLGWSIPLSSEIRLRAVLPLAFADLEETVRDEATGDPLKVRLEGHALGNPYLGVDLPAKRGEARFRLGLWLPVAPGYGECPEDHLTAALAASTDFVRDAESFVPDALALGAGVYHDHVPLGPARLGLRGGVRGWFPVDDRQESEFFVLVGADLSPSATEGVPTLFTDGRFDPGASESWYQVAGVRVEPVWGRIRPRLEATLPVNPVLRRLFEWSLEAGLTVDLP